MHLFLMQCVELFSSMTSNVRKDSTVRFIVTLLSDLTEVSSVYTSDYCNIITERFEPIS